MKEIPQGNSAVIVKKIIALNLSWILGFSLENKLIPVFLCEHNFYWKWEKVTNTIELPMLSLEVVWKHKIPSFRYYPSEILMYSYIPLNIPELFTAVDIQSYIIALSS